jgi:hypothetical protein
MRGVAAFCLAFLVVTPSAAQAQSPPDGDAATVAPATSQPSSTSPGLQFLSAYQVRMGASRLVAASDRFTWDARFNGDVDLVAYGGGRVNFMAEYEAVLGSELRKFDPNQSLYTLDLRVARRYGGNEFAGVFHHVSRHLSDRPKLQAIDWNAIGAELTRAEKVGLIQTESLLRADWIVKHSYVDYTWRLGGRLRLRRPTTPHVTLLSEGSLDLVGTDAGIAGRNTQVGAYLEGGARLGGSAGSLELILAFERRVDADPLVRGPKSWVLFGFRLVTP